MATQERLIETPTGTKLGKIFDNLEVLGMGSFVTQSGNQSSAHQLFQENVHIEVPVGTIVVIPAPNLWLLGYGSLQPEVLDPLDDNQNQLWHSADHHWGAGVFQVSVVGLNAPDFSQNPPKQTAHLHVNMLLSDHNGDDSWFGVAGYNLLYLGKPPRVRPPIDGEVSTGGVKIWKGTKLR